MFTGLIEEIGTVKRVSHGMNSATVAISAARVLEDANVGDSIAVNGICLTVTLVAGGMFSADVMHETLNRSSLGSIATGSQVNLERAMAANGRFGGHMVTGHIDGLGKIVAKEEDDIAVWFTIEPSSHLLDEIVEKGSIAIDGISLTVARVNDKQFAFSAIPHTLSNSILQYHQVGDIVNIETDILSKYVRKMLHSDSGHKDGITVDFLAKHGF